MADQAFPTSLGWMGIRFTNSGVAQLAFGHESQAAALHALGEKTTNPLTPPAWMEAACRSLDDFASGLPVDLNSIPLDLPPATPFQQRVREVVRRLGYGQTASYGEIAARAGVPGAARAVGTVMSSNPVPLLIPCHRVLGAGGRLGGYSAPQGLSMKRQLLTMEQNGQLVIR